MEPITALADAVNADVNPMDDPVGNYVVTYEPDIDNWLRGGP